MRLKILTLNVENMIGDPRRQAVLNAELRRIDPDLVALQEVVSGEGREQLDLLLAGTGLKGTHQSAVMGYEPPNPNDDGNSAVATRWDHRVVEVLDLRYPETPITPWSTLAVVADLPVGEVLFIVYTGAADFGAASAQERQVVAVTDLDFRHRTALPTIIAGDFNAGPEASCTRYLRGLQSLEGRSVQYYDAWEIAGDGPGYTWGCDNPRAAARINWYARQPNFRRRIDYVFIGSYGNHPGTHCTVLSANLAFDHEVGGVWPSDHFGVLVEVEIGPNEEEGAR
jgi:endonuclease/exonuclease/phosphatase family metal-dependent hydrolase